MASYTAVRSTHQTLSTTVADTITFALGGSDGYENVLCVANDDTAQKMYFTYAVGSVVPTTPTAGLAESYYCPPQTVRCVKVRGGIPGGVLTVKVVGSANIYHVELTSGDD